MIESKHVIIAWVLLTVVVFICDTKIAYDLEKSTMQKEVDDGIAKLNMYREDFREAQEKYNKELEYPSVVDGWYTTYTKIIEANESDKVLYCNDWVTCEDANTALQNNYTIIVPSVSVDNVGGFNVNVEWNTTTIDLDDNTTIYMFKIRVEDGYSILTPLERAEMEMGWAQNGIDMYSKYENKYYMLGNAIINGIIGAIYYLMFCMWIMVWATEKKVSR